MAIAGLVIHRRDMMTSTSQDKVLNTVIPDLRNIPLDHLAQLGASPLAHSIQLYHERLKKDDIPPSAFNARILGTPVLTGLRVTRDHPPATGLVRLTGHPAPWPHLDLDVAQVLAAGHEPVPFRQFILKVHSRCNLSCSYCYVYEMADQSWRQLPRQMSRAVVSQVARRIAEHADAHRLPSVDVILHGGEPLLAGASRLTELAGLLRGSGAYPGQPDLADECRACPS